MKKSIWLVLAYVSLSFSQSIIFLHHSTGGAVYSEGSVQSWFTNYNNAHQTQYKITETSYPNTPYPWENYPYDYWNLWVNHECNNRTQNIWCLDTLTKQYNVVIFKHCFPGADVLADLGTPSVSSDRKSIENYKLQYRALRTLMDSYPNTLFMV